MQSNWEAGKRTFQLRDGKPYSLYYDEKSKKFHVEDIPYLVGNGTSVNETYYQLLRIREIMYSYPYDQHLAKIWNCFKNLAENKEDLARVC